MEFINGDSYFYISRILILWLILWSFRSAPSWARWTARIACMLGIVLNLPTFTKPAPEDFDWKDTSVAILQGVPARIPILPEGWVMPYPGKPQYLALNADWWTEEHNRKHWWCWSAGTSTVIVASSIERDVHVRLYIKAEGPRRVTISHGSTVLWTDRVANTLVPVDLALPTTRESRYLLTFASDPPGVTDQAGSDPRILAFEIYDWKVLPPDN